jgi:CRISPR-associated endoribonuclease Cas6
MRLHFYLSPNLQPVPFDYQHFLTGTLHKWICSNHIHDLISLYSLSWLYKGRVQNRHLHFPNGAYWFLSIYDEALIERIVSNALIDSDVCCGMKVIRIDQQETPEFGTRHTFRVGSPVLARSKEIEGKVKHYIYSDIEADDIITTTLRHKMDLAGLNSEHKDVTVYFDRSYKEAKTKLVKIKNTNNRASICPVTIEGTPEAIQFAWNVGVGHLTGSGFGSLV